MSSNDTDYTLTSLLVTTPYTLAYVLPLLLQSAALTFAGTFLTIDRTRAFAPRDDVVLTPSSREGTLKRLDTRLREIFLLEGGVGGLAVGYIFGVHFSTFLALAIPNTTTSSPLSPAAFIAVWAVSAIVCTMLAGRWKYAALTMAGITGYATLSLALCVIAHPALNTRIAIMAVVTPLGTVASLLPLQRYQHAFLRAATSSAGAFSLTLTIALLAKVASWSNVWERLWVSNGTDGWSSTQERGLSAGFCLFLIFGAVCDWLLHRTFGENPDQKWDAYLADYTNALPNDPGRAGTFVPIKSFWSRHFGFKGTDPAALETIYPMDLDLKLPPPSSKLFKKQGGLFAAESPMKVFEPPRRQEFLRKPKDAFVPGFKRTRPMIKFSPLGVDDLSDEDDEDDLKKGQVQVRAYTSSSGRSNSIATLVNEPQRGLQESDDTDASKEAEGGGVAAVSTLENMAPNRLEYEEDVTTSTNQIRESRAFPDRMPPFMQCHSSSTPHSPSLVYAHPSASLPSQQSAQTASHPGFSSPALAPVPATPSLIRAIDRVSRAQQEAYSSSERAGLPPSSNEVEVPRHTGGWQSFWRDVKT